MSLSPHSGAQEAPASVIEAVLAVERRRREALRTGDRSAIDALYGEDLYYCHANGRIDDKRSAVQLLGGIEYVSLEARDEAVRLLDGVAVVTACEHVVARLQGAEQVFDVYSMNLWSQDPGRGWRLSFRQSTAA